eukprot:7172931-Prymnesium_polylepis.1
MDLSKKSTKPSSQNNSLFMRRKAAGKRLCLLQHSLDIVSTVLEHIDSNVDKAACMMVCSTFRKAVAPTYKPGMMVDYLLRYENHLPRGPFQRDVKIMLCETAPMHLFYPGPHLSRGAVDFLMIAAETYLRQREAGITPETSWPVYMMIDDDANSDDDDPDFIPLNGD